MLNFTFLNYSNASRRAIDFFLEAMKRQNKSHHTIVNYEQDLKRLLAWVQRRAIWRLSSHEISQYLEYLKKGDRPLSVASQKRHLSTLKNFYEYLVQSRWRANLWFWTRPISRSPVLDKIHYLKLKDVDRTPTPMLPAGEWHRIEEMSAKIEDKLALYLLYYGGLRLFELSSLRWRDFNRERKSVFVSRKGGKTQELFLQQFHHLGDLLEKAQRRQQPPSDYLFTSKKGDERIPLSKRALYQRLKQMIARASSSPSLSPHSFRKACATLLYQKTKDLLLVRDYLNHADAGVTQSYIDQKCLDHDQQLVLAQLSD